MQLQQMESIAVAEVHSIPRTYSIPFPHGFSGSPPYAEQPQVMPPEHVLVHSSRVVDLVISSRRPPCLSKHILAVMVSTPRAVTCP